MKSPYVDTLVPNEPVTAYFLVLAKEIRQKKTGEPYLSLYLADRTGEIEAKMWDNVAEVMDTFERDDFVKVKGQLQVYQNRSQFTVHRLRRLSDGEVDLADFFPCSEQDPEIMFAELERTVAGFHNPHLKNLLAAVFHDANLVGRFKTAPAAKSIHHACRGGLLEHVLSLTKLCRLAAAHYGAAIDEDLLLTGAILHDVGKIEELTYVRSFGYSSEGQLLGHIVIGLRIVGEKIAHLPDFPPKLRTLIEHMIVSHHGELEFGSPKVPLFAEALLLHHLDNLDSKMEAMKHAIKRDRHVEGEFTGWIGSLERSLLRKELYMRGPATVAGSEKPPEAVVVEQHAPIEPTAAEPLVPEPAPPPVEKPLRPAPAQPLPHPPPRPEQKPAALTLFGEKLQAVLDVRK
jgi:3'-5' exoribonuclease